MADMNEEMEGLLSAMEDIETPESKDELDGLMGVKKDEDSSKRGRAEKERADRKKDEESGVLRVLKKVLPIVGAGVGALVVGLVLGAVLFSGGESEQPVVHEIDTVNLKSPILEQLDSVKDAQIRSLEKSFTELETMTDADVDGAAVMAKPFANAATASAAINGLLDTAIALSPTATDAEVRIAVDHVSDYMTSSGVATTPYRLMTGASPAKELNKNCKKASQATLTLSGMSADGDMCVVTCYVPVMAEDSTLHEAVYVVLTQGEHIETCEYVGVWTPGAGVDVDGAIASAFDTIAAVKNNDVKSVSLSSLNGFVDESSDDTGETGAESSDAGDVDVESSEGGEA